MIKTPEWPAPPYQPLGKNMIDDANQKMVAHLAEAPGQIQPLLTSLATHCRPEMHEGNLYVTVPFETVRDTVAKARTLHRQDVLASVLILSLTAAMTVIGILIFIK